MLELAGGGCKVTAMLPHFSKPITDIKYLRLLVNSVFVRAELVKEWGKVGISGRTSATLR